MIEYAEALQILYHYTHEEKNLLHAFFVEAIMRGTASLIQEDECLWGIVGLLHDLDTEYSLNQPELKGMLTTQLLEGLMPQEALNAILARYYVHTDIIPISFLDKALIASDAFSELIMSLSDTISNKQRKYITKTRIQHIIHDPDPDQQRLVDKILLINDIKIDINEFIQQGILSYTYIKKGIQI